MLDGPAARTLSPAATKSFTAATNVLVFPVPGGPCKGHLRAAPDVLGGPSLPFVQSKSLTDHRVVRVRFRPVFRHPKPGPETTCPCLHLR